MSSPFPHLSLQRATDLDSSRPSDDIIATLSGRLVELSSDDTGGALTAAALLIRKVHEAKEDAAWISAVDSIFFPPDFAANGIDLSRLPIVHVPSTSQAARVADHLLRSSAFRLLVLDLGNHVDMSLAQQGRLVQLAGKQQATVLLLTDTAGRTRDRDVLHSSSFGSLVSLHGIVSAKQGEGDRFRLTARITKDKRNGPGWKWQEVCRGPAGVC